MVGEVGEGHGVKNKQKTTTNNNKQQTNKHLVIEEVGEGHGVLLSSLRDIRVATNSKRFQIRKRFLCFYVIGANQLFAPSTIILSDNDISNICDISC